MALKEKALKLKEDIPAVFMALKHKSTPRGAKFLAALTVGLALSPVDLIPDFIPVLGYLDDLLLLPALVALTVKLIPGEVMEECRQNSRELWKDGRPVKWGYAIPIVLIWLLIIYKIAFTLYKGFAN